MRYFDRHTDSSRYPDDVTPLIQGLLENRQRFGPEQADPPFVTEAIKYSAERQDRRATSCYEGDDPFVRRIIDIFGSDRLQFKPLNFQVESWQTVNRLARERLEEGTSKAAVFSAPTGFGKTEAFLGSLYQLLLDDRQDSVAIVYPSRALLQDQLKRMLEHVHGIKQSTGKSLSVGLYIGNQPWELNEVEGSAFFERGGRYPRFKLANCWCSDENGSHNFEYRGSAQGYVLQCENDPGHRFTDREMMLARRDLVFNNNPDILLTTLESLEGFAHKPHYPLLNHLDTIVLDEVHLYTQLRGAHAAKVIDNVDTISDTPLLWLGSSATIDDAARFGKRIFGVDDPDLETVAPPEEDFDRDHTDKEHYYFMLTPEEGPGVSSMSIQQYMLLGHSLLESPGGERGKLLGFIDSISQVNQKRVQLEDADENRELWRYHTADHGDEDWEELAEAMGARFIDGPLDVLPVFSDHGFDSDEAAGSDILLSTSFLEVGIDVGEIKIVTQYRTPWDLSSFLQRSGRAARKEGMDAHVAVFLSNLTDDANMFYRAERFLKSDIRTPLKTDNPVVEWIHGKFQQYYRRAELINDERYWSEHQEHRDFLEGYLVDDLGWAPVYQLLIEPATFFQDRMDESLDVPSEPLLSTELVDEMTDALNAHLDDLGDDFSDIEAYFDMEGGNVVRGEDAVDAYVAEVQTQVLNLVQTFLGQTQGYRARLSRRSDRTEDQGIGTQLEAQLDELRTEAAEIPDGTPDEKLQHYSGLLARLYGTAGQLMQLRVEANSVASEPVPQVKTDRLDEVKRAVDQLDALIEDDRLAAYYGRQREVFYLKAALKELRSYLDGNGKPFMSLYSVKSLLRCSYYVDRYLRTIGDRLSDEIWFVPPDYYGSSGQFMAVFRGEDDREGTEESIDKLVSTFTPYRSEYQAEAGVMQAFLPKTTVTDDGVEFTFDRYVTGQERDGVLVPDSIQMSEVTDLADAQALNIVRYCPVCLQIISDLDRCLRHNERELGKIHADAQVSTTVTDRDVEEMVGGLSLADVSTEVTLDGVSLEITPADYMGSEIGYRFTGEDRLSREISSPETPLGFRLDTRGLVFDLSAFLDGLDEQAVERVERYKDLDEVKFQYLAYHTAAHFFLQLVADVSSVNTTNLLYGFDESEQEVYVFERTEGGQGVVDLVFEELRTDPASVLESITRVAYNPQVINERLWADRSFVLSLPEDGSDEETVSDLVEQHVSVPYGEVLEQVTQECIATIDRCQQLASDVGASPRQTYRIKSTVAREQIDGTDEFPREEALEYDCVTEQDVDRIKTLFYSPDIDGCVENLQLTECMASGAQSDTLSYVLLDVLRSHLIQEVPTESAVESMFDRELPPAGEFDGTSVFLDF